MIALISQLHWNNLGTALQAYALHKKISDLGFDNEYIDCLEHRPKARVIASAIKQIGLNFLRKLRFVKPNSNYWETRLFKGTFERTEAFRVGKIKRTVYTPYSLVNANERYNKFVVGSDQMWFPDAIMRGNNPTRLLTFVKEDEKKYSYAPSFGTTCLSDKFVESFGSCIKKFKFVSCRERSNAERLTSATGRKVEFVLDPTMLLSADHWRFLAKRDKGHPQGHYILCYILGTKECISQFAEALGKKNGWPVYYILTHPHYACKKNCIKDVGPQEFISLVDNCSLLVTDSFHGIMFSVKLQKSFYVFNKLESNASNNDNDRIIEVLTEFNLLERFCKDDCEIKTIEPIDYNKIDPIVNSLIESSENYLKTIINS